VIFYFPLPCCWWGFCLSLVWGSFFKSSWYSFWKCPGISISSQTKIVDIYEEDSPSTLTITIGNSYQGEIKDINASLKRVIQLRKMMGALVFLP